MKMTNEFNLFDSIKTGMEEAIEFSKGELKSAKVDRVTILPIRRYGKEDIKTIRQNKGMSQRIFAQTLGVSKKTIEAWEAGTSNPSGTANRLLELLELDNEIFERYSIVEHQATITSTASR